MVQACDDGREQHKRDVQMILSRLRDIRGVYSAIQQLDALGKATLLNLYYPRKTMEQVAELMGVDVRTVQSRKAKGIENLVCNFR